MKQSNPYHTESDMQPNETLQPLFWNRILRLSIYFTVFGVGLGGIKFLLSRRILTHGEGDEVENLSSSIDNMVTAFGLIFGFLLFGITCIIISLIMRAKERKTIR